ncbi:MAG TPA: hypothetical protein PLS23_18105, partial [Phycisphaerae bacterium]|nr:hypothetical protein [Phycisphaerae bacterium]
SRARRQRLTLTLPTNRPLQWPADDLPPSMIYTSGMATSLFAQPVGYDPNVRRAAASVCWMPADVNGVLYNAK